MHGLSGAQRTGKSTLAKKYAETYGIPYLQTSASGTFDRLGFSPKLDYPLPVRLEIQNEILKDLSAQYKAGGIIWITDRTPIDLMAYMLADVQRQNVSQEDGKRIVDYMERCYEVLNRHFTTITIVQPGIPLTEAATSAPANIGYMEHINALALGLAASEKVKIAHFHFERWLTDLDQRVIGLNNVITRNAKKSIAEVTALQESGQAVH